MPYQKYQSYQDSKHIWIGEIPTSWSVVKLKAIVTEFIMGDTPNTNNQDYWSGDGMPWVSIADISAANIYLTQTAKRVSAKGLLAKNLKSLKEDTVLFSIYASIGKTAILKIPAVTNQAIVGIVADKKSVTVKYLYYALLFSSFYIQKMSKSTIQPNLSLETIKEMPIPLPSLPEQKKIVAFLDDRLEKTTALISKKEVLLNLLDERLASLRFQAVTQGLDLNVEMKTTKQYGPKKIPCHWEIAKLKYLVQSINNGTSPPKYLLKEGIPVYGANGLIGYCDTANTDNTVIVIGRVGSAGKIHLVRKPAWISDNALILSDFGPVLDLTYFYYQLLTLSLDDLATKNAQPLITASQIANLSICLPPLREQKAIAQYLNKETKKNKSLYEQTQNSIVLLKEYQENLINSALTGKINCQIENY